eukprot:Opistho-1_new@23550
MSSAEGSSRWRRRTKAAVTSTEGAHENIALGNLRPGSPESDVDDGKRRVGWWRTQWGHLRPYVRWWSVLIVLILLGCLALLPYVVYREATHKEQDVLENRFLETAIAEQRNIGFMIDRTLRTAVNLRIPLYLEGRDGLSYKDFMASCDLLSRPESLAVLIWNAFVRGEERDAFEANIRRLNNGTAAYAHFEILELVKNGLSSLNPALVANTTRAANRTAYIPLMYMWTAPSIRANSRIGIDLMTSQLHGNVSGPILSGDAYILTTVVYPLDRLKKSIYIFTPTYEGVGVPDTPTERWNKATGLLATIAGMSAMVEEARAYVNSLHVYIFEEDGKGLMYAENGLPLFSSSAAVPRSHGLRIELPMPMANRVLTFVAVPTDELVDMSTTIGPPVFAAVTAIAVAIVLVIAVFAIRKIIRTQRKVSLSEERRHLVNQMIGYVNHEIRNPLNGITGLVEHAIESADKLLRDVPSEKEALAASLRSDLKDTSNMCDLMRHIIDDVLDIRCLDEGRLRIIQAPACVQRILSEVAAIVQPKLSEKAGMSLSVAEFEGEPIVICDAVRCKQVLVNFIVNSIKYSDRGTIFVRAEVRGDPPSRVLHFSVTDSGKGIEDCNKGLVFRPFMQLNGAVRHQGVGLGLYLCSLLAKRMLGNIGFESKAGVGSTFWFEVPYTVLGATPATESLVSSDLMSGDMQCVVVDAGDDRSASDAGSAAGSAHSHAKEISAGAAMMPSLAARSDALVEASSGPAPETSVEFARTLRHLVCDDGRINRVVLRRYIEAVDAGCVVDEAENGLVACELAAANDYDIIWMDVKMPVMDGMEATQRIQAGPRNNTTAVVGVTGDVTAGEVANYRDVGMFSVLSKPVSRKLVAEAIAKVRDG